MEMRNSVIILPLFFLYQFGPALGKVEVVAGELFEHLAGLTNTNLF